MSSELEKDYEKITALSTEEIRRGLAVQKWGSEARKIAEAEVIRRGETALQQIALGNLAATAQLVEQTTRLAEATDRLVSVTGEQARYAGVTATATRWLAYTTGGLLLVTALLVAFTILSKGN